jgi:20S proteasome alpha/beta subunit
MKYQAKAIGSGSEGAQTELQKEYHKVQSDIITIITIITIIYSFFIYSSP